MKSQLLNGQGPTTHTGAQRFALDSSSPAAAVIATRYLEKLGGNFDIVQTILDDLNSSFTSVILRPYITLESVSLITRMASSYKNMNGILPISKSSLLTAQRLIILVPEPYKTGH